MNVELNYFVYIMANNTNSVIYIWVTNDLRRTCYEHKNKLIKGFTYKYNTDKLVCIEHHMEVNDAIK